MVLILGDLRELKWKRWESVRNFSQNPKIWLNLYNTLFESCFRIFPRNLSIYTLSLSLPNLCPTFFKSLRIFTRNLSKPWSFTQSLFRIFETWLNVPNLYSQPVWVRIFPWNLSESFQSLHRNIYEIYESLLEIIPNILRIISVQNLSLKPIWIFLNLRILSQSLWILRKVSESLRICFPQLCPKSVWIYPKSIWISFESLPEICVLIKSRNLSKSS